MIGRAIEEALRQDPAKGNTQKSGPAQWRILVFQNVRRKKMN